MQRRKVGRSLGKTCYYVQSPFEPHLSASTSWGKKRLRKQRTVSPAARMARALFGQAKLCKVLLSLAPLALSFSHSCLNPHTYPSYRLRTLFITIFGPASTVRKTNNTEISFVTASARFQLRTVAFWANSTTRKLGHTSHDPSVRI